MPSGQDQALPHDLSEDVLCLYDARYWPLFRRLIQLRVARANLTQLFKGHQRIGPWFVHRQTGRGPGVATASVP